MLRATAPLLLVAPGVQHFRVIKLIRVLMEIKPVSYSVEVVQKSPLHFTSIRTAGPEFAFTAIFHQSSLSGMVSVRVNFHLFNFVIEMIMEIIQSSCENGGTNIYSENFDLEFGNDVLENKNPTKLQLLDCLNNSVAMVKICFVPSKCRMLLHDWTGFKPSLIHAGEKVGGV